MTATKLIEFSEKARLKIQSFTQKLAEATLWGNTSPVDLDNLREMASFVEDISYEMSQEVLCPHDSELYAIMGDFCKIIERVLHDMDEVPTIAQKVFLLLRPHYGDPLYCTKYNHLPAAGELVNIAGHCSGFRECPGDHGIEADFVFLYGGEVVISFSTKEDWESYYRHGEVDTEIVIGSLEVTELQDAQKGLMWRKGKSEVLGGAPE